MMLIPIDRPLIDARNIREAATQTISANDFTLVHNNKSILLITTSGSPFGRISSAVEAIADGVVIGQELTILFVTATSANFTILDNANTVLKGDWVRNDGEESWLKVVWDGSNWVEVGRNRGDKNSVASGIESVAEGIATTSTTGGSHAEGVSTTASGSPSHAEGSNTVASGSSSHAEGNTTAASGNGSHTQGLQSIAALYGEHAQASGRFAANGDAQRSVVLARIATTDETLTETFLDGVDDLLTILDEYTYACKVTVVGRQDTGVDHFMGTYHVLIERTGGVVALVGAIDSYENNAGGWGAGGGLPVSILAGATNLEVWVEGLAGHNIRWEVRVDMDRVGYSD